MPRLHSPVVLSRALFPAKNPPIKLENGKCLVYCSATPKTANPAFSTNIPNISRYFSISADAWQLRCTSMTFECCTLQRGHPRRSVGARSQPTNQPTNQPTVSGSGGLDVFANHPVNLGTKQKSSTF